MSEKLESMIEKAKEGENVNLNDLNWYQLFTLKEMIEEEIFYRKNKNLVNLVKSIDELQEEAAAKKEKELKEKHPVVFGFLGTLALAVGAIGMASDISEKISDSIPVNYPDEKEDKEDEVED